MKHFAMFAVVCACFLASACGVGDGTVASCVTSMTGSIEGERAGLMAGQLLPDGTLNVVVAPDDVDREFTGDATVDELGTITPTSQNATVVIDGQMDLDSCEASGDWQIGPAVGTWAMEPRKNTF